MVISPLFHPVVFFMSSVIFIPPCFATSSLLMSFLAWAILVYSRLFHGGMCFNLFNVLGGPCCLLAMTLAVEYISRLVSVMPLIGMIWTAAFVTLINWWSCRLAYLDIRTCDLVLSILIFAVLSIISLVSVPSGGIFGYRYDTGISCRVSWWRAGCWLWNQGPLKSEMVSVTVAIAMVLRNYTDTVIFTAEKSRISFNFCNF